VTDPNSKFLEAVPPRISPLMNQQLEANISIQEIKYVNVYAIIIVLCIS
jgi:hypothetical protein